MVDNINEHEMLERFRQEAALELTKKYEAYLKDRKSRVLYAAGFFLIAAVVWTRVSGRGDGEPLLAASRLWVWGVAGSAAFVSSLLAIAMFAFPPARKAAYILGGITLSLSLVGYLIAVGVFDLPLSIADRIANAGEYTFWIGIGLATLLGLVLIVPAGLTDMKAVLPVTDEAITERADILREWERQRAKAAAAPEPQSAFRTSRRIRRR